MNSTFVQIPKLNINKQVKKKTDSITANTLLPKLMNDTSIQQPNQQQQQQQPQQPQQVTNGITILQNYQPQQPQPATTTTQQLNSANNTPTLVSTKKSVIGINEIPEHLLIRDIIYVFQGIDGTYIKYNKQSDSFKIDENTSNTLVNGEPAYISKPKRDLVYRLCEFGWLFKKVRLFITNNDFKKTGLTNQSFCSAINDELIELYRIIAILETQVYKKFDMVNYGGGGGGSGGSGSGSGLESPSSVSSGGTTTSTEIPFIDGDSLTLIRLFVWIQSPLKRLKVLGTCVDSITVDMKGGEILSKIDTLSKHGDQDIRILIHNIMFKICQPLFSMIRLWMFKGEINDPYQEFFIRQYESVQLEKTWKEKFAIVARLLPSFISLPLSKRILIIGKSINYMKQFCNNFKEDKNDRYYYYNQEDDDDDDEDHDDNDDDDENENQGEDDEIIERKLLIKESKIIKEKTKELNYINKEVLQEIIELVSRQSSERLLKIVLNRFKFMNHVKALKKYLLLGQGDFIQYLMDLIGEDLLKPTSQIQRHKLVGWMDTAIRNSNAQFEEQDIVNRLDIALLPERPGNIGWDIFSLDYHVDTPLNTILSPNDILRYKKIFHFMWGIKRVEYSLASIWRKIRSSTSLSILSPIGGDIHKSHLIMNEMVHFISNFQYYLMFEVLECSWKNLEKFIDQEATDLDQLIEAHHQYLQDICNKMFLSNSDSCYECFKKLLSIIIKFTLLQTKLINLSIAIQNEKNFNETHQAQVNKEFNSFRNHLNNLYQEYTTSFYKFQSEILKVKVNQDLNPISLQYMLDFNEYYEEKKDN
ncbi:spindle pole body component 98 [Dictyostelium discoideum AX4]|uniref:Spindle pole body component 98 n=1 Tax=Dictyostelium discoideum TaxID=44689 RepID=SPC98_DICDI|nr:spindle pole body component 98 [Dictyostelium discoideum AX4]Q95ZG4.2 RecName: Full=Spindle pole body component 98; AltName: Full=DdSpc98; Short=Spc98 [Dictyostelium discoideum]EAL65442.1 spindle pole body component 98 [Dictyostelium discoideum AX4]|eukprot:XP_638829.1 spindle pole body component 98 [Dictyostelium discoideum AX4]